MIRYIKKTNRYKEAIIGRFAENLFVFKLGFGFFADLFKLVKERLMFEVVRNIVIESGNDFVDLLLPTGIHILTQLYGLEKFSKRLLIDPSKAAGYLRKLRKHGSQFLCFYFISIFYLSNLLCMAGCYPCLAYIPGSPPRVQLCRHCQKPFKTTTLSCCSTIWGHP